MSVAFNDIEKKRIIISILFTKNFKHKRKLL